MGLRSGFFKTIKRARLVLFDLDNTIAYRDHHFAQVMVEILHGFKGHEADTVYDLHRNYLGKSIECFWSQIKEEMLTSITLMEQEAAISHLKFRYLKTVSSLDTKAHQKIISFYRMHCVFYSNAINIEFPLRLSRVLCAMKSNTLFSWVS